MVFHSAGPAGHRRAAGPVLGRRPRHFPEVAVSAHDRCRHLGEVAAVPRFRPTKRVPGALRGHAAASGTRPPGGQPPGLGKDDR